MGIIETLITSSVLIVLLTIFRVVFRGKISLRLQYALWGLVVLKLIIPYNYFIPDNVQSSLSVMNAVDVIEKELVSNTKLEPIITNIKTGVMTKFSADDIISEGSTSNELTDDVRSIPLIVKAAELDLQLIIMVIWFLGTVSLSIWMLFVNLRFSKYLIANRKTYIKRGYELPIYVVPNLSSPCLYSIRSKPAVYITPDILNDSEKLEHVLAHEYSHFKHYDHIWSLVRCGLLAFYWVNPFIWLAAYLSKRDCELACDEATIMKLGEEKRLSYGRTLIQLISAKTTPNDLMSIATSMTVSKKGITERIRMIAKKPKMLRTTVISVSLLTMIMVVLTFTSAKERDIDLSFFNISNLASISFQQDEILVSHSPYGSMNIQGKVVGEYLSKVNWYETKVIVMDELENYITFTWDEDRELHIYEREKIAKVRSNNEYRYYTTEGNDYDKALKLLFSVDTGVSSRAAEIKGDEITTEVIPTSPIEQTPIEQTPIEQTPIVPTSITPTVPIWASDMTLGADGPVLDYASQDYIIFHGYFGLYVYDLNSQSIIRSLDLKAIDCNYTQGDNYCEVSVSKDGLTIYLHNITSNMMYVYQVEDNTLDYVAYEEMGNRFDEFVDIKSVLGEYGSYSYEAVVLKMDNKVQYGYLSFSDWTLGSLEYIVGDSTYKLFVD